MDVRLDIVPVEDATAAEVAAVTEIVRDALARSGDVRSVEPVRVRAPDHAKGFLDEVGALLLGMPAGVVTGVLDLVRAIVARQPQPVVMKVTAQGVELTFDPKRTSFEQLGAFVARVQAGLDPTPAA